MKKFFFLFFLFFLCSQFWAEDILKGHWERSSYKLGDEAVLTIVLPSLTGNFFVEGIPAPKTDFSDFRILDIKQKRDSEGNTNLQLKMIIFATGKISFPVDKVKILTENGETSYKLEIPLIEIEEKISSTDSPPEIASPVEIPKSFPLMELVILIIFLIIGTTLLISRFLRKKKLQVAEKRKSVHQNIEEYLINIIDEKLKKSVLSIQDYSEITDNIRVYLEQKCQIEALFMTTSELLEKFRENFPFQIFSIYEASNIFFLCDLVKFAKHFPNEEEEKRFRGNLMTLQKELKEILLKKERAA